jgi:SAM-dependent methyltransferase
MAKISELLQLRDRLQIVYTTAELSRELGRLTHDLGHVEDSIDDDEFWQKVNNLIGSVNLITDSLDPLNQEYSQLLKDIQEKISIEEIKFFGENYKLELKHNAVDTIRNLRVMNLQEGIVNEVLDRIRFYTNWKYPTLEIGCRDGEWTHHLIAADPLYIVDYYRDFTESAIKDFPEEYQRRIRVYLLNDIDSLTATLPLNQFNFIFCWNFLNYASFDTIKEYLKAAKLLLRPGGTFMFSYNDGDRPAGAAMAENRFMTYVPKHMLVPLCESLGFEITNQRTRDVSISWIEVRKPGELETNKAHQVLGEIKRIND